MAEKTLPDENIISADALFVPPSDVIVVEDAPPPESIAVPSITGGVWVSRTGLIVCLLLMVILSAGLSWWLFRRAHLAEQGRLEAVQRLEQIRKKQKHDQIQHNQQPEKNRAQLEFDLAVEREKGQKLEGEQGDLMRERNWLQFENNRLRHEQPKPPPSRIIIVR